MTKNTAKDETGKIAQVNALKVAEHDRPHFTMRVDDLSTTPEDIMRPEYWVTYSKMIGIEIRGRSPAVVDVFWADNSRYMRLFVLAADKNFARVVCVQNIDLANAGKLSSDSPAKKTPAKKPSDDIKNPSKCGDYKFEWINHSEKIYIKRLSDDKIIEKGLPSKEAAQDYLDDYLKALKD